MRHLITVSAFVFVMPAQAGFNDLMDAVKADDVELARRILTSEPTLNVNHTDQFDHRPIFHVSSPDMLMLLLHRGAKLRIDEHGSGIFVDRNGMNPLHFLLAITAPRRLAENPTNNDDLVKRIEATAFLLMRVSAQDDTQGRLHPRIELQADDGNQLPVAYLTGSHWRPDFVARLRNQRFGNPVTSPAVQANRAVTRRRERRTLAETQAEIEEMRADTPTIASPAPMRIDQPLDLLLNSLGWKK